MRTILCGLDGLFIISADIVEVAPVYDTNAELTTMAAADVSFASRFPSRIFSVSEADSGHDVGLV